MRDLPAGAGVDPVSGTELRCGHGATPIPGDRWADGKLLGNATDSCTGATQRPLEPVYNLFRISIVKASTTICRLVLSFLSQFFQSRRHFSS